MIRLSGLLSLIFFACTFAPSCKQKSGEEIIIIWSDAYAAGISIPTGLLKQQQADSISTHLQVRLQNNPTAMLGEYSITEDKILFKPAIPLTRGMTYHIMFRDEVVGKLKVPLADPSLATSVVKVFPTQDTVPENLLKIYVQFSAPMREGEALNHIALLDEHNDTLPNVFLNLQPELWNKERTALTVWLDPGRIKRDLIPNQKMGNPLQKGHQYTLLISDDWKDVQGLPLHKSYTKKLFVTARDSISPQPALWNLQVPAEATSEPLTINLRESLDYFLLGETVRIMDSKGNDIAGNIKVSNKETLLQFIPAKPWQAGQYIIQAASHLEDLAGNNLNRPFDRDIKLQRSNVEKVSFVREFAISRK
jgi:hypothetical protein